MKFNKNTTTILIAMVGFLWILIGVRVYKMLKKPQYSQEIEEIQITKNTNQNIADTFTIIANYRDPFFLNYNKNIKVTNGIIKKASSPIGTKVTPKTYIKSQQKLKWPTINYLGLVNNTNSKQKIAFIKIDNKDYLIQEKDSIYNILVDKLETDSIIFLWHDEVKCFYKSIQDE